MAPLAWEGPFRGYTEMVLWRGSGIGVGAAAVALVLQFLLIDLIPIFYYPKDGSKWLKGPFVASIVVITVLVLLLPVMALFVMACRLCLVVESLVRLAYVPDGVFELPNWALYFPHIG